MSKRWRLFLPVILLGTFVIFKLAFIASKCPSHASTLRSFLLKRSRQLHVDSRVASSVQILGVDYEPEEKVETSLSREVVKYVFIVPHKLDSILKRKGVDGLSKEDQEMLYKLTHFLDKHTRYNGATGTSKRNRAEGSQAARQSLEQDACRFLLKNWTIVVRNSGTIHKLEEEGEEDEEEEAANWYQECNITENAFAIRKQVFLSLRWRAECGKLSYLDFFVRSHGALKIAKLSDCFFSRALTYTDRGILQGTRDLFDYLLLGNLHNILRIVRPNKIEWTKCADDKTFCSEKPLPPRLINLKAFEGYPICCDVVMNELLVATVKAMNAIGMEHRIVYGTLLGAVRSQAFIPYSDDVDMAIHKVDNDNFTNFKVLQRLVGPRFFVAWKTNPPVSRVYPHFAPSLYGDTRRFFQASDSLESTALFDTGILKEMEKLLPVKNNLLEQRYVDLYPSPEHWFGKPSEVTINNRRYPGVSGNVDRMLRIWYGDDYMEKRPEKHSKTTLETNS